MTNHEYNTSQIFEIPLRHISQSSDLMQDADLPMLRMEYIVEDFSEQDGKAKIIPISECR
ncbi:MAG: hypothetical protein R3222_09440 [Balneolaceae bacterium]|nr:hypothetical protein [Balneolaceae bacterium]